MTIKECYDFMGGNYEDVIHRLMNDKIVVKFAIKFLSDLSYDQLVEALKVEDYETAFRASHTIKGVCKNLGFARLSKSSDALTEALRGGKNQDTTELEKQVMEDYELTVKAVHLMEETEVAKSL